ncbi:MAG: mannose-6-phosphate isomerase [Candidatus Nealsonbacteria bacterium]
MLKIEKDFKRPWGGFIKFIDNKPCTVKILQIKKDESFSLQSHKLREEFWYVVSGKIKVITGKNQKSLKKKTLKESQSVLIPPRILHMAEGITDSKILEISTGIFKENDEIRYWDKYGRTNPK